MCATTASWVQPSSAGIPAQAATSLTGYAHIVPRRSKRQYGLHPAVRWWAPLQLGVPVELLALIVSVQFGLFIFCPQRSEMRARDLLFLRLQQTLGVASEIRHSGHHGWI